MDKNIIKETMLSLERPVGESPMYVLRRLRACGWPAGCQCIVHRSKLHFTRGVRAATASVEPSGSTTGPILQIYRSEAKRVFVAYQIEEEAPRVIGAMTRTMRTFTLLWTNCEHGVRTRFAQNRWDGRLSLAGARLASVRMDKPGAFEWKRFLLEHLL